jgi:maltooligosyltrehalose trehalohydrolase
MSEVCLHDMPFGAQVDAEGITRFRLWAPAAQQVEIEIEAPGDSGRLHALRPAAAGWHELSHARAPHGTRYRYRIEGRQWVPDPASRFNPDGVHGVSEVIDPRRYRWRDTSWAGRPWEEAVLYELHVGTFTTAGTYQAAAGRLDYLAQLGVTAVELMPLAHFDGARGWGYDGVLPFAPHPAYGSPAELRDFIQAAHARRLMVFLDVVYNHFGPEGNYLHTYAPQFFVRDGRNEWGDVIDFSQRAVRDFFIHNALYWLEEYRFDGLRFDAVEAIVDHSDPDILRELAQAVRDGPGRTRRIHLVLENYRNGARYLRQDPQRPSMWFNAQWNDDLHHAAHVLLTGERAGYYVDYSDDPVGRLGRCLREGFCYQDDASRFKEGQRRGEPSSDLETRAFVSFLQNHDQIGNRPFGERITALAQPDAVRALVALVLLAPFPPLLFMGEEFAAAAPFLFFCDFNEQLAAGVRAGRERQFAAFWADSLRAAGSPVSDPNDPDTFRRCKLAWESIDQPAHLEWLELYRRLLRIRARVVVPRIGMLDTAGRRLQRDGASALRMDWPARDGTCLSVRANLAGTPSHAPPRLDGETLYTSHESAATVEAPRLLVPWSVEWVLAATPVGARSDGKRSDDSRSAGTPA